MLILGFVLIFYVGMICGFFLNHWLGTREYDGVIHVEKTPEKTIYSLEIDDEPEAIELMNKVTFKVELSE